MEGPSTVASDHSPSSTRSLHVQHLSTYLNDHLSGATAGSRLAARLARTMPDPELKGLDVDVQRDRETLRRLMGDLGVAESRVKRLLGAAGELGSRLKLRITAQDRGVAHLLAVETLTIGVEGKLRLWRALEAVEEVDPRLSRPELAQLAGRAEQQLSLLETVRVRLAVHSLAA